VFLGLMVAPVEPVAAALTAQLAGPGVVLAVLGVEVTRTLRAADRTAGDRLTAQVPNQEGS